MARLYLEHKNESQRYMRDYLRLVDFLLQSAPPSWLVLALVGLMPGWDWRQLFQTTRAGRGQQATSAAICFRRSRREALLALREAIRRRYRQHPLR
jgi:hypothetical protein